MNSTISSTSDYDTTTYTKDLSFEIETKDIFNTIEQLTNFGKEYGAFRESSISGNNGSGSLVLKVPSDEIEKFTKDIKDKFNVTSYECYVNNVEDDYDYINSRTKYLKIELEDLQKELEEAKENNLDTSEIISQITDIKDELYQLKQSKENTTNDVLYSSVYISLIDKTFTNFSTFSSIWLAIKTGAHLFILGIIYGLYAILYGFLMILIIKKLKSILGKIKFKSEKEINT